MIVDRDVDIAALRSLMTDAGLSPSALASLSGLNPSTISRVLKGRRPTTGTLYRIAKALEDALNNSYIKVKATDLLERRVEVDDDLREVLNTKTEEAW